MSPSAVPTAIIVKPSLNDTIKSKHVIKEEDDL